MFNSERIKEIRKRTGLTQKEFAFLFNIPIGTYRNWEQDRTAFPDYVFDMLHKLISDTEEDICSNLDEDETLKDGWKEFYNSYMMNQKD